MKHARPTANTTRVEWMPTGLRVIYANGTKDVLPDRTKSGYPPPAVLIPVPAPAAEVAPIRHLDTPTVPPKKRRFRWTS